MRRTIRFLTLALVLCFALGTMTLTAAASELTGEAAFTYLDSYADNVAADPNFDNNIQTAIAAARDSVGSYATLASLIPPVIAIGLALLTKEVYTSLFAGILSGALLYANWNPWGMVTGTFDALLGSWNTGILAFLVVLGMLVSLVNKSGGSAAYGRWAGQRIRNKTGALLATSVLGMLIFIDDYFNCLTVGSVMRPVTDKHRISREKLAYLIDATAAPVCIIAPISSWAAAVSSVAPEGQGLNLFIQSIPYNLYALLMLFSVVFMALIGLDYGKMRIAERRAEEGLEETAMADVEEESNPRGTVLDLVLPVVVLILCCIGTMLYTGGFFDPASAGYYNLIEAFSGSDASVGLVLGGFLTLVFTALLYLPRKIITLQDLSRSFTDGFTAMVPAILILIFAWTLSEVTNLLGAKVFVAELVRGAAGGLKNFLPAVVFLIGMGLSFATGTSWGTFGVLLPIVCAVFPEGELMVISVSACLAGAVCGDHCSPISDTTIMASAGAQCEHMGHVSTQLPYVMTVAAVSFGGYILAGFVQNVWIVLPVSVAAMAAVLLVIRASQKRA